VGALAAFAREPRSALTLSSLDVALAMARLGHATLWAHPVAAVIACPVPIANASAVSALSLIIAFARAVLHNVTCSKTAQHPVVV